jgi:UDP-3-O-[3-hydroxymyristoyl] glucosamine N-acyltransferase
MQVEQIAGLLGARFEGDGALAIAAGNDVTLAGPSEIAFVEGTKAAQAAASSRAGCLLAPEDLEIPGGRTVIRVPKPRNAFARILRRLHPEPQPAGGIHPTAVVAASAAIGPGASIGPQAVIGESASVGAGTVIGAGVTIGEGSKLGENCRVYPRVVIYPGVMVGDRAILHAGCVLGSDGFGFILEDGRYEKFPQIGRVEIGNDVEIGANACVDRGALGATVIGDGSKLDNMVHIGHNCRLGRHVVIAAQTGLSGGVVVEDYVVMGGQVGISEKARIETRAIVGAQCGILPYKVLEAGQTFWGTPSRPHREHLQRLALVNRLPKVFAEMEALRARLESLEGSESEPRA